MSDDPFDSAENPVVRQAEFWGKVELDMFYAVLQKGVGKVPFDPQQHSADKRVTAIDIKVFPVAEQNVTYDVSRNMIAESREWAGIVLPSIKSLGLTVRELNGKYVHVVQKATGATYENKSGETKEKTTFEFVKLFPTEAACIADYMTAGGTISTPQYEAPARAAAQEAAAAPANGNGNGKERETALKFLGAIVENAARGQTDVYAIQTKIAGTIATIPLINKHFTADSPEVLNLIVEKMQK